MKRTHYCNELTIDKLGLSVTLCGWVRAIRNKGSIVWMLFRDSSGSVQVVYVRNSKGQEDALYQQIVSLKKESVVEVSGIVKEKPSSVVVGQKEIELAATDVVLISKSKSLPFNIDYVSELKEDLLLRYRYLYMRGSHLRNNLLLRNKITILTRSFLDNAGFLEVRTPHLVRPTIGGAKEFMVKVDNSQYFALAQGPQIYMELLMAGGFDRCYQICHCICNEDSRHNRQIEFDQLHCEMAFMDEEDVMNLFDEYLRFLYKNVLGEELREIPRISWHKAIKIYGNECPDVRNGNNTFCPIWITDIPMFKKDNTKGEYKIKHHPFTAIHESDVESMNRGDYKNVISRSYNLSINGVKVGGSSVRNYDRKIQEKIFMLSGMTPEEMKDFDHFLNAMDFGMPPHAGMSFGFDRLCAVFGNSTNVKEYMFFPKSSSGKDLMTGAPTILEKEEGE